MNEEEQARADHTRDELDEKCRELAQAQTNWHGVERVYHWAITTLVGLACVFMGMFVQAERYKEDIVASKTKITTLEAQYGRIETTLADIRAWQLSHPYNGIGYGKGGSSAYP
jgi:hypothetical protein